jgi:hypothetical protein
VGVVAAVQDRLEAAAQWFVRERWASFSVNDPHNAHIALWKLCELSASLHRL